LNHPRFKGLPACWNIKFTSLIGRSYAGITLNVWRFNICMRYGVVDSDVNGNYLQIGYKLPASVQLQIDKMKSFKLLLPVYRVRLGQVCPSQTEVPLQTHKHTHLQTYNTHTYRHSNKQTHMDIGLNDRYHRPHINADYCFTCTKLCWCYGQNNAQREAVNIEIRSAWFSFHLYSYSIQVIQLHILSSSSTWLSFTLTR